jgi:CHAT domain-containing protein/tetratricopeptide (TPR) repeat protein
MNSSINNKESIREYLLGRVTDESLLSELEELLFVDEQFCEGVEAEEEELINEYVFGRMNDADSRDFEKTLANNPQRRTGVDLTFGLKEKAKQEVRAEAVGKRGFLESIGAFFKQPAYAGGFAVLAIVTLLSGIYLLRKSPDDLAELRSMYSQRRQTEARISGFDYAPFPEGVRGNKSEEEDAKTAGIKANLLKKAESDPSAKNNHALGVFFLNRKNFPEAIKQFNLALQTGPESADLHNDLGTAYFELAKLSPEKKGFENLARATDEFSKALQLNPEKLEALFNKSLALQEQDMTGRARESWNLYLQKDPSSKWAEEARKNLEILDRKQSSLKTKEQVLDDFLSSFRKRDDEIAWKIISQTRDTFSGMWLPQQLSRRYIRAQLRSDPKEEKESIDALIYIGNLEKERNADFFVSDFAGELLAAGKANAGKLEAAQSSFDAGLTQARSNSEHASLESFAKSGRLFLEGGSPVSEKLSQYWSMQVLQNLRIYKLAGQKCDELLAYTRSKNYKWLEAAVLYSSGTIFYGQKALSRAMDLYLEAFGIAKQLGDTLLMQRASVGIIEKLIKTGEYSKAETYLFSKAGDLYYSGGNLATWRSYYFPARLLLKLKLNNAAAEFAFESLATAKNSGIIDNAISSLAMLAQVKAAGRQTDDALVYAGESLALLEKQPDDGSKLNKLAVITLRIADLKSELGRCEESLADFKKVIALFTDSEYTVDRYAGHRGLLMCLKKLDRGAEVAAELETVLSMADGYRREIMEDESRQAFFDNEQDVFDIAIEDSLSRGDGTEAFQRAERSRARSLLDIMGQKDSIDRLQRSVPGTSEPLSASDLRSKMPANAVILEYALLEGRLVTWVVSNEGLQTVDARIDTESLNSDIVELARLDRDRNSPAQRRKQVAAELFRILVAPVSKLLDPAKPIVIIPDKTLYYVPFASLVAEDGKFMVEQFTISYAPSATIFVAKSGKGLSGDERKTARLLSVGDPDFDREEFPGLSKLKSARAEAIDIGGMLPGSQVLTGKDATRDAFMRAIGEAQMVHFAGHYLPDPDAPSRSQLVLAGGEGGSGLRISEIAGKKLPQLKLVVLSACETGIENVVRGEGSISASRDFLAAGVQVVVASQWQVDSEATEKLMVAFYRNRGMQDMSAAAALRRAQLDMLKDPAGEYAAPYYWAAFNVTGGFES